MYKQNQQPFTQKCEVNKSFYAVRKYSLKLNFWNYNLALYW